ncbi:MAG TPA: hypothetical protein PKA26_12005 [bacterium]|nr:hypothetical protein [bacterium]
MLQNESERAMQRIVLILIAGIFTTGFQSGSTLVGYHAKIRTTVYEDLSVARAIELSMDADLKEAVKYKKDFFRKNGYELIEKNENDRLTIVAQKVFPTASHRIEKYEDDLSAITVEKEGLRFSYREDFYTKMFKEEIERSDLRNDLPVAKMLMADTKFEFYITLPGKIDSLNSGEFDKATAHWTYDVDELMEHKSMTMRAHSTADRGDIQIWMVFLIGVLLLLMAYLLRIKLRMRAS